MTDLLLITARIGDKGRYYHRHRAIVLHPDLTQAERRSTLAHELVHAERGDEPCCSGWHEAKQERSIDDLASRRLIGLDRLTDALRWSQDECELAEELWVDVDTVRTRLERLTDAEKDWIEDRLWAGERGA